MTLEELKQLGKELGVRFVMPDAPYENVLIVLESGWRKMLPYATRDEVKAFVQHGEEWAEQERAEVRNDLLFQRMQVATAGLPEDKAEEFVKSTFTRKERASIVAHAMLIEYESERMLRVA